MACETIKMEITTNPDYVSIIRLTASGIANKMGFPIDDIEDIKVAVSEACTNAIKHSKDDVFNIVFNILDNAINIEIQDNGKGFNVDEKFEQSYGLKNMRERALEIGATFHIVSLPDSGTRIEVKAPLNKEENSSGD